MSAAKTSERYLTGDYLSGNPSWDIEDAPWKAALVHELIARHGLAPRSIAEVGCGAGGVLAGLRKQYPEARLCGYDIAPDAAGFWQQHEWARIEFVTGDFLESSVPSFDLLLLLDVLEHLENPFDFLAQLRGRAAAFVFHIPLDLSCASVLREAPLLHVRRKVGHIHYFTKGLALALLEEAGYEIVEWRYTGASLSAPRRGWKTRFAAVLRRALYAVDRDAGVRLAGGDTLLVLAQARAA